MKLLSAAIAFSTLATSQAATSSSSAAISETKRLRNVNVYKSEKNGPADRDGQSFSDVRALQFLDIEVSMDLSGSLGPSLIPSLPSDTPTTAPSTGAPSTGAPSLSGAPTSDTPTTSMAPSAAPSGILAKGEESKVPSSTLAPSTAAPYPTIIETPILTTESPISTSTQCTICETGEIIDSELIISGLDVTCGQASDFALTVPAGEAECTQVVAAAKDVCCQMEFPSDIDMDGSMPTISPIGIIDTTAPSPSSSSSLGTSSDEPSSSFPTGAPITLIPAPKNSAMMMSTMGGATCLIASLIAYVGLF